MIRARQLIGCMATRPPVDRLHGHAPGCALVIGCQVSRPPAAWPAP
jgi:hypothetical protein